MEKSLSFGVGCFHFKYLAQPPFEIKGADYLAEIKKSLQSITNISNLDLSISQSFEDTEHSKDDDSEYVDEGFDYFPYLPFGDSISFDIYIPNRIQLEILSDLQINLDTENFRVTIIYGSELPTTIIELLNAPNEMSPSLAVMIVREFLNSQLKKNDSLIELIILGPSPFHADFYIYPNGKLETEEKIKPIITKSKGYDKIVFEYNEKKFNELDQVRKLVHNSLIDHLGIFYLLQNGDLKRFHKWTTINMLVDKLIQFNKTKGLKYLWHRITKVYTLIEDITILIADFELYDIEYQTQITDELRYSTRDGIKNNLVDYIFELKKEIKRYSTSQLREILSLIENRRSKKTENLIALIASILGGIIGSIITLIFSKN